MAEAACLVGCDSLVQIKQRDSLYSLATLTPLSTNTISTHNNLSGATHNCATNSPHNTNTNK